MGSTKPKLRSTYHDYLSLPDDERYELIDGDLLLTPAPRPYHQIVSMEIAAALRQFVKSRELGIVLQAPCDVYLSEHDVVQPDVFFIRRQRKPIIEETYVKGPPDLVVEILSPSTADRDLELKRKLYARFGVPEYWMVDPMAKTVQILLREGSDWVEKGRHTGSATARSSVLKGFALPLEELFAPL